MSAITVYDTIGRSYTSQRRADPRIAARLTVALAGMRSVLNVGAGAGSYEPAGRSVVAVEPSAVMLAQRPRGAAPAVRARAEALPFADRAFDAVMAVLTVHHWADRARGLAECARVARGRVVLLTWDPAADGFWLVREYFPAFLQADREQFPPWRRTPRRSHPGPGPASRRSQCHATASTASSARTGRGLRRTSIRRCGPGSPRSHARTPRRGWSDSARTWRPARGTPGTDGY